MQGFFFFGQAKGSLKQIKTKYSIILYLNMHLTFPVHSDYVTEKNQEVSSFVQTKETLESSGPFLYLVDYIHTSLVFSLLISR